MTEPRMTHSTGATICLFDERGTLIGTIDRPVQRDPLGPGHPTVYLARPVHHAEQPAVAA
jgi:hypothetical protein